jgi:hypothetical protein
MIQHMRIAQLRVAARPAQRLGLQPRSGRSGLAVLVTLALILTISGLLLVLQQRSLSNRSVLAGLARAYATDLAEDAVFARARVLLANAMTGGPSKLLLDGTPLVLDQEGEKVALAAFDVSGLPNLLYAPQELFDLIPSAPRDLAKRRDALFNVTATATPASAAAQFLARLRLSFAERQAVLPFVTISGTSRQIAPLRAPAAIKEAAERLPAYFLSNATGQTVRVGLGVSGH